MWPDPRKHRRYTTAARQYLDTHRNQPTACALCGQWVDMATPSTTPAGPTIEHQTPIRWIRTNTQTWAECLTLACDTSRWAIAHRQCQDRQGGQAAHQTRQHAQQSRQW